MENRLFSNRSLIKLIVPLVIEQGLTILVGMADGVMVASVGEAPLLLSTRWAKEKMK